MLATAIQESVMPELERIKNGFFNRYPDRIVTIDSHTQGEPTRYWSAGWATFPAHNKR
jgi:hypothetical protein